MEVLRKFDFATIVCDGCARRVDSHINDEWLKDYADLMDYLPDDLGWERSHEHEDKWLCPECVNDKNHRKHPGEGRIIIEPTTLSEIHCDLCGKHFENYEGYAACEDFNDIKELAREDDWVEIGDKIYCPDCYKTCGAMADEDEENYEEVYCKKCPYENDCPEYWPRERPEASSSCEYAVKNEDGNWKRCPFYKTTPITAYQTKRECLLEDDGGEKCPRVAQCKKDRVDIEKKNKELIAKINKKGK